MKIKVQFLGFHSVLEQAELELDMKGNTVAELIRELTGKVRRFKEAVLKQDGRIDEEVLVILNEENQLERERIDTIILRGGDTVTFMLMAGGG
jgi:hypothetical protein